jgi:hypothetical protein
MKRLALLNSYKFNSNDNFRYSVCNFLAAPDNIGNLVYLNFLEKSFANCESINAEELFTNPERIKEDYDLVILPLSNMLSEFYSLPLADIFYKYNIKILLLSVGIQYPLDTADHSMSLSKDAVTLLNQAKISQTPIGARGRISHAFLGRHGYNSVIIGCPSVFGCKLDIAKNVQFFKDHIVGNCTFSGHHKDLSSKLISFIVKNCKGYSLQDEARIIRDIFDVQLDEIANTANINTAYFNSIKNNLFEYGYYNDGDYTWHQIRDFFKKHCFFSVNLNDWMEYLKNYTCSIGLRFHGNILAMHCGVPSVFIPCDARTMELIDYHCLPHISDPTQFYDLNQSSMINMLDIFYEKNKISFSNMMHYLEIADIHDNWKTTNNL